MKSQNSRRTTLGVVVALLAGAALAVAAPALVLRVLEDIVFW